MPTSTPPLPICGHCGASDRPLLFCSRCHAVRYCDAECQRRAWRHGGHRESCNRVVSVFDDDKWNDRDKDDAANATSSKTFRLEELRFALYHMPDDSKVGPDGFSTLFYKTFFDHLGPPMLKVLEERLAKGGSGDVGANGRCWVGSGLATRELVPVPREKRKLVSLRGSLQRALKLNHDENNNDVTAANVDNNDRDSSFHGGAASVSLPSTLSASIKSRPAISRQLRAMTLHPEVDYVIFTSGGGAGSAAASSAVAGKTTTDQGVGILNADARLLFRVNWNHAVFATAVEDVAPHARLLYEQLRGPPPRDEPLDRKLVAQLRKEFGCDVVLRSDVTEVPTDTTSTTNPTRDEAPISIVT